MKKIINISIFILVLIWISIASVNAYYEGRNVRLIGYGASKTGINFTYPNGATGTVGSVYSHTALLQTSSYTDVSGSSFSLNCLDPGLSYNNLSGIYKIKGIADATTDDLIDLGSLAIYNKAATNSSRYDQYTKTIALRSLYMLTSSSTTGNIGVYRDIGTKAINLAGASFDELAKYGFNKQTTSWDIITNESGNNYYVGRALELLTYAIEVINYKINGAPKELIEQPKFNQSVSSELTDNVTIDGKNTQKVIITLSPENIADEVTRIKNFVFWINQDNIDVTSSSLFTLYTADGQIVTSTKDASVLTSEGGLFVKKGYKLTIELEFIANKDFCDYIKYGINYELKSDNYDDSSYVTGDYALSGSIYHIVPNISSVQRYLTYKSGVSHNVVPFGGEIDLDYNSTNTISDSIYYCPEPDKEVQHCPLLDENDEKVIIPSEYVKGTDEYNEYVEKNCPKYCQYLEVDGSKVIIPSEYVEGTDEYNEYVEEVCPMHYCTNNKGILIEYESSEYSFEEFAEANCPDEVINEPCKTEINFDNNCEEDKPSMNSEDDYLVGSIIGPTDISKCIINNTDEAESENPYTAGLCSINNDLSDNKYCTVACKEDYTTIKMSGSQHTMSGKYFKVGLSLNRTKSCYSSKIDTAAFESDMEKASDDLIEATNKYNYNNALYGSIEYNKYSIEYQEAIKNEDGETTSYGYYYFNEDVFFHGLTRRVVLEGFNNTKCKTSNACEFRTYTIGFTAPITSNSSNRVIAKYTENNIEKEVGVGYYPFGYTNSKEYYDASYKLTSSLEEGTSGSKIIYYTDEFSDKEAEIKKNISYYENAIKSALTAYNSYETAINACSSWEMSYDSEPVISYNYEEDYMGINAFIESGNDDIMVKTSNETDPNNEYFYCTGEYDDEYKNCNGSIKTKYEDIPGKDIYYQTCTTKTNSNGTSQYTCSTTKDTYKSVNYIKQTNTVSSTYDTKRVFYTAFPSGNIIYDNKETNESEGLQTEVVDGLPIMTTTTVGKYKYSFTFSNVGEYYDCSNDGGRLIGGPSGTTVFEKHALDSDYICYYYVDCPDCDSEGDKKRMCPNGEEPPSINADGTFVCGDDSKCYICPFTTSSSVANFSYRPISTNGTIDSDNYGAFNPNNREIGYNWNVDNQIYEVLQAKAIETLYNAEDGILNENTDIYSGEHLVMSVKLTPALASYIRKENETYEANGGYTTDTITCGEYTYKGVTYNYVQCMSDFLSDLITNYDENFSGIAAEYRSDTTLSYWTMYEGDFTVSGSSVGGPSWK